MEQEKIAELAAENMKTIFAYSLSRVSHREDAEDLAGDIILAILQSGPKLRDDNAFFGYIWAIAANTYKKFLQKRNRIQHTQLDEELAEEGDFTQKILRSEEYGILRRELALLSREYRECTVAYYFDGLSCAETASKLHISLEMVKYYLFKTRKILKEGISMEREFGVKSYNPEKFQFRTIFSGKSNMQYQHLFDRKLPGNILLATYYIPMTIRELAVELGVASAYLEDEIDLLKRYNLLTALPGGKYQAHLVIFTADYLNEFSRTAEQSFAGDVYAILSSVREKLPEIRAMGFPGSDFDDNRLLWALLFELTSQGWYRFKKALGVDEEELYRGSTGVNYGVSGDRSAEYSEYTAPTFAGFAGINKHYAACYADFGILPKRNRYSAHRTEIAESLDAVLDGNAEALLPVISNTQKKSLNTILSQNIKDFAELYEDIYDRALSIMSEHAPKSVSAIMDKAIANTLLFNTVGLIGACAVRSGALTIPDDDTPLGAFIYETENA